MVNKYIDNDDPQVTKKTLIDVPHNIFKAIWQIIEQLLH